MNISIAGGKIDRTSLTISSASVLFRLVALYDDISWLQISQEMCSWVSRCRISILASREMVHGS